MADEHPTPTQEESDAARLKDMGHEKREPSAEEKEHLAKAHAVRAEREASVPAPTHEEINKSRKVGLGLDPDKPENDPEKPPTGTQWRK